MSVSRFTSFFSDRYQLAKSKVTNLIDSQPVKQVKQTLTRQINQYSTSFSDKYWEMKSNVSPIFNKVDPSGVQEIKNKIIEVAGSESVLQTKEVIESALKATVGVHYIFDLGLKCIPVTSPMFTALEFVKYACVGFTFVMASYKTFDEFSSKKTPKENLESLTEEMQITEEHLKKAQTLLTTNTIANRTVEVDYTKLKVTVAEPAHQSYMKEISASTSFVMIQSVLEGAVKSMGYLYLANWVHELFHPSVHKALQKQLLFWTLLSINSCSAYFKNNELQISQIKLSKAEEKIPLVYEKLIEIERSIGTKEALSALLQEKKENSECELPAYPMEEIRSKISVFAEQEPIIYLTALIHGATLAAGVNFIFDQAIPVTMSAKYFMALSTMIATTMEHYHKNKENNEFQKNLKRLSEKNQEIQDILMMTTKIGNSGFFKEKDTDRMTSCQSVTPQNSHRPL